MNRWSISRQERPHDRRWPSERDDGGTGWATAHPEPLSLSSGTNGMSGEVMTAPAMSTAKVVVNATMVLMPM
jgi:hypothetical protein